MIAYYARIKKGDVTEIVVRSLVEDEDELTCMQRIIFLRERSIHDKNVASFILIFFLLPSSEFVNVFSFVFV